VISAFLGVGGRLPLRPLGCAARLAPPLKIPLREYGVFLSPFSAESSIESATLPAHVFVRDTVLSDVIRDDCPQLSRSRCTAVFAALSEGPSSRRSAYQSVVGQVHLQGFEMRKPYPLKARQESSQRLRAQARLSTVSWILPLAALQRVLLLAGRKSSETYLLCRRPASRGRRFEVGLPMKSRRRQQKGRKRPRWRRLPGASASTETRQKSFTIPSPSRVVFPSAGRRNTALPLDGVSVSRL